MRSVIMTSVLDGNLGALVKASNLPQMHNAIGWNGQLWNGARPDVCT